MLSESYTSVSCLINMEPAELLHLQLSEPIASDSEAVVPTLWEGNSVLEYSNMLNSSKYN